MICRVHNKMAKSQKMSEFAWVKVQQNLLRSQLQVRVQYMDKGEALKWLLTTTTHPPPTPNF